MDNQLYFDWPELECAPTPEELEASGAIRAKDIRRAALGWLVGQGVRGMGVSVPTRFKQYFADIAAFWNVPDKLADWESTKKLYVPTKTIIIECRGSRDRCWPDCSNSQELLPELRRLKDERRTLESDIRKREPELREADTLFDEFSEWNYGKSVNSSYHKLCRRIARIEHAIYAGSRFERLRHSGVADFLYLAVPEKAVHPYELANDWGLIWINDEFLANIAVRAKDLRCLPEQRFHLVQNIAAAAKEQVMFSFGLRFDGDAIQFLPFPRKRRKPVPRTRN